MEQRKPREAAFDRMRVIAILGIIIGCVSEFLVSAKAADGQALGFTWHLSNLFSSAVQFAVPLLLMSLGAILLEKEESVSLKDVIVRRVLFLMIPLAVWSVIYLVFRFLWQGVLGESFVVVDAIRSLLNTPVTRHLWLLYLLLAIYLVLPFLRLLVAHAPRTLILFAVGLWFAYSSIWPALSALFPSLALPNYGNLNMLGGYIGFPLFGWLLATTTFTPKARWMLIGFGGCVLVTALGTALMTKSAGMANFVFYQAFMPNMVLMSAFVFMACRTFDRKTVFDPWLPSMAHFALGIYLIHELYYLLLLPLIRLIPGVISLLLAPPLIGILSLISVAFLRQVKVIRLLFLGNR